MAKTKAATPKPRPAVEQMLREADMVPVIFNRKQLADEIGVPALRICRAFNRGILFGDAYDVDGNPFFDGSRVFEIARLIKSTDKKTS